MSNLLQGNTRKVVRQYMLGFIPHRNLTADGTVPTGSFSLFQTFHQRKGAFEAFIHLFETDLRGGFF
jgi:hypothetical protein